MYRVLTAISSFERPAFLDRECSAPIAFVMAFGTSLFIVGLYIVVRMS